MKTLYRILIVIAVALTILITVLFVRMTNRSPEEENCEIRYNYQ